MDRETKDRLHERFFALPHDQQTSVLYRTLGGIDLLDTTRPEARIGEAFDVLGRHLDDMERTNRQARQGN